MTDFTWRTESDEPAPAALVEVDDRLTADAALKQVRAGAFLHYRGDFHNAKQLLAAMGRRLKRPQAKTGALTQAFRAERAARALEHETLARVVVSLDAAYRLELSRAPDVALACEQVWGPSGGSRSVVSLKTLVGMLGAAQWRRTGLEVPGLAGRLTPHYGVYLPTRTDYVELLRTLDDVAGKTVFDVGAGTGVLGLLLLQRGAKSVTATDCEARAVACARENAAKLGLADRFQVEQADLFPPGRADLVVCNPPWLPEPPKNRVDRAVFDQDSAMLRGFVRGLREHLAPGGRGVLLLSDLAELLGLRPAGWLEAEFDSAGLVVVSRRNATASHPKAADERDPLHRARSKETTSCWVLTARSEG